MIRRLISTKLLASSAQAMIASADAVMMGATLAFLRHDPD
jgi:hypothetical protein